MVFQFSDAPAGVATSTIPAIIAVATSATIFHLPSAFLSSLDRSYFDLPEEQR
jgi:hypothetical protein